MDETQRSPSSLDIDSTLQPSLAPITSYIIYFLWIKCNKLSTSVFCLLFVSLSSTRSEIIFFFFMLVCTTSRMIPEA